MFAIGRRPLLAGLVASAAAPRGAAAQGAEIRFGALYPFSGGAALLGDESFRGLELAVEERNGAGGVLARQIRLAKGDAVDEAQAIAEVRRLMGAERVPAVFGTYASRLSLAATQVAEVQGIPYFELGASAEPITERGFRSVFRTCPRSSDFAAVTVASVQECLAPLYNVEARSLRIAILHEDSLDGQTISDFQETQIKARGLQQAEKLGYAARATDFGNLVQRLRGAQADIVLHTGQQHDAVLFFRAMQEANWRPRMVVGAGGGYSLPETARAVGPAFDGTLNVDFAQFAVNERFAPGVAVFVELYKRRYGSDPRSGHSLANYVGARVFLDAIHRAGGMDRDRLRTAVLASDAAEGTTANGWGVRFDEKGQNTRAQPVLMQWQEGRQVTVHPARAAVTELRGRMGPGSG